MQMLSERGLLREREGEADSFFESLRPISDWFRRTISGSTVSKD